MTEKVLYINSSDDAKRNSKCAIYSDIIFIFEKTARVAYHIFLIFVRFCLSKIYGKGQQISSIKNELLMESATLLAQKIRNKQLKSIDVVNAYISRIEEINPILNCVIEDRFRRAIIDACNADKLIESEILTEEELAIQKPLLGVPFTTKDSIQVKGMLNTAGLWLRRGYQSVEDAKTIQLLKEAGAIPLALTNVPELCMWWESFNTIFGRTNNPYDTTRTVGGSSGGEGCIQASGGSAFGLGSDIGGSIRMPAFFNGIFGHKPSKLIVSNHGQFPPCTSDEHNSFLSIGPMCRYAIDLKLILKVISDDNSKYLNLDEPVDLNNVNIFYQLNDGGAMLVQSVDKEIENALFEVVKHFEKKFSKKPKCIQLKKFRESLDIWFTNMKDSSGIGSDQQLANLEGKINPYTELLKFCFGNSNHTLIAIGNAIIERFQTQYGTPAYFQYVEKRDKLLEEIQNLLNENGVLLYPTHPTVAPYHWEPYTRMFNFSYTAIFNCMGLPSTAVPLGLNSEGLPLGIQVVANHNQDRLCLAVAEELEKAFGGWVAPTGC
ncbi:fatty-acid amide hydrolase 2-A-like [Condylostylus longicornis]|uniref:fatty-acid amide hydrolase 2-A-like n=1 Tax=Condylostylus longicornis TaxID=2530218 RepID=UPI00244E2033|nr:fatty-acid amide hydrolase 2-A-like [Condylostylus longicornis]